MNQNLEPQQTTSQSTIKQRQEIPLIESKRNRRQERSNRTSSSKLENERAQEQLNAFEASEVEETKAPSSLSMKLNMNSGQTFGMVPQGSKIQSII